MRILLKGGVWKNTEDEILKAAVMKYGKNQWARVASLLNRKSAKQCKARWYEWLDPSIKKTEWTREEEEKLLHLAKLMPNQWRTIAPIVGRTAGQCTEHYERLLDQAQEEAAEVDAEDPRRLRPGEIDPAPETKPARPDPIDMDEDDLEMLAEARARLANTKGKKAKRKARERMMDESRRMAMLQKRRELKAAGIESKISSGSKRNFIDYAKEIPFQKVVPSGFYDISDEVHVAKKMTLDPKVHGLELSKLEGRHAKEEEEKARKRDAGIMKKLYKDNAPLAVMKVAEENDPVSLRRRLPLHLPAPQVTDHELEEIVKLGKTTALSMAAPDGLPSSFAATQALIGDYSQAFQPHATPLRTPQREDIIMQEAKNHRILRDMTPLTAQEVPELYEGTGFEGMAPRRSVAMTPNQLTQGTPNRAASVLGTPAHSVMAGSVAGSVVSYRDQFGLNASMPDSFSEVSSVASKHAKNKINFGLQQQLRSQLSSLPEPEYTYEVSIPSNAAAGAEDVEAEDGMHRMPEDAADIAERHKRSQQAEYELAMARRSSVLKRGLPRPVMVDAALAKASLDADSSSPEMLAASAMINAEMVRLALYELKTYPPDNVKPQALAAAHAIDFVLMDLQELQRAQDMIAQELAAQEGLQDILQQLKGAIEEAHVGLMFIGSGKAGEGQWKVPRNKAETLAALKSEFKMAEGKYDKDQKRLEKLENKYSILTQGYLSREAQLKSSLEDMLGQHRQAAADVQALEVVRDQEARAAEHRIQQAKAEAQAAHEHEVLSQDKYAKLLQYARECGMEV